MGNMWTFHKIIGIAAFDGHKGTGNSYYSTGNYDTGHQFDYIGFGTGNYSSLPRTGHVVGAFGHPCNSAGAPAAHSGNYWFTIQDQSNAIVYQCGAFASGENFIFTDTNLSIWYPYKSKFVLHVDTGGVMEYYYVSAVITDG